MKTLYNPPRNEWDGITRRPAFDTTQLFGIVRPVLEAVRQRGDEALREYEEKFDHVRLDGLQVTAAEFEEAAALVSDELKAAIEQAYENISRFHAAQRFTPIRVETAKGVFCEQRAVPIERVGLYIPGGTAPLLSTVLMLAVPATIAGCETIVLCSPPSAEGKINPAILYTAARCGVTRCYKVGGAQAIAAMAAGTQSIPKVNKIFGPGNQYVMAAKQLAALDDVAIDMPAGPSEVEVLADESADIRFVAADLLSQAEHGVDSQVLLVTTSRRIAEGITAETERQLAALPRRDIARKALDNSTIVRFDSLGEAIDFTNAYAPEHLILALSDYKATAGRIRNAGSVFMGNYSSESAGDYASGTNHTLPTRGYAKAYSGLNLDAFIRKMTLQEITTDGVTSIARTVEAMAAAEQLDAHRNAMAIRRNDIESKDAE